MTHFTSRPDANGVSTSTWLMRASRAADTGDARCCASAAIVVRPATVTMSTCCGWMFSAAGSVSRWKLRCARSAVAW